MSRAQIAVTMQALGNVAAPEHCEWCERAFERGETMIALEDPDTKEPLGWWCRGCIDRLKKQDRSVEQGAHRIEVERS